MLDTVPALSGDDRITRLFTLVPGSDFGVDVLAAVEAVGGRLVPWSEACARSYDLILTASPKGDLRLLRGRHVLLPHGAGYNKSIPGEGSDPDSASGLDPAFLLGADDGTGTAPAPVALHAVAHPDQVARIAAVDRRAADRAKVVGDPTLDRLLASRPLRERYRAALGTGARRLLVLVSTWGPESLLRRFPDLPARLAARLPQDEYQLALVVHPNEHSLLGTYDLTERLAPALDAGLVLAGPHEEWASVLIAADALVTDHGSTALYYCATEDRPVVGVHQDGAELIPGSPMHTLLARIPRLGASDAGLSAVEEALRAYRPGTGREAARTAFAQQGRALRLLRTELYALLGLTPPALAAPPRLLPEPRPAKRVPTAFDVDTEVETGTPTGTPTGSATATAIAAAGAAVRVRVARRPVGLGAPGDHLAAEHGSAGEALVRSAGVLYRRPLPAADTASGPAWTADGWIRHALSAYPGCRTAAAILAPDLFLLRTRARASTGTAEASGAYAVQVAPLAEDGRVTRADPAAAVSAVHAGLLRGLPDPVSPALAPARLSCVIGDRVFALVLRPATDAEAAALF
ncbi:translation initiation factor 2 [Streptomyces sp. NPDC018057]|uniref:translation initiation factor 2 n=1 Tax=unclassified Streptomyces TaxID=2593676 RepID=UPI0037A1111D